MSDPIKNTVKMAPMAGATGYGGGVMSYSYSKFGGDTENWITITD